MFADYIKNARGRRGLSQREVADCLYVSEKRYPPGKMGIASRSLPCGRNWGTYMALPLWTYSNSYFRTQRCWSSRIYFQKKNIRQSFRPRRFSQKSIEDTLQHHDAGHGYCWDYVLTLTRQEFEVCKYLMQAHEGMTIFEAWDTWIQPRNTRMTRRETLCCS